MPRIYSPVEDHNISFGAIDFINGVSALPSGANTAYFDAEGYSKDINKHEITIWDMLTRGQLESICDYLGVSYDEEDTKQAIVRAIETYVSTVNLGTITVTSTAGTEEGDTNIVTDPTTGTLVYKLGEAALAPLYMDDVSDWVEFNSGDDITAEAGQHITVAEIDDDGHVLALGSDAVVINAGT